MALVAYLDLDKTRGFIVITAPYVREFVEELKATIHYTGRFWDAPTKKWSVAVGHKDILIRILAGHYASIEFQHPSLVPVSQTDYYGVLHLLSTAPVLLIQAAYRCLAIMWHPDKQGGNTKLMQDLNIAYQEIMKERK